MSVPRPVQLDTSGLPACVACGCCCFSSDPEYVRVFDVDLERMDDHARSFVDAPHGRPAMRMRDGRCAALTVDPEALTYVCAIYAGRPDVCRSLDRGSGGCLGDRVRKREAPLLAVAALLRSRG